MEGRCVIVLHDKERDALMEIINDCNEGVSKEVKGKMVTNPRFGVAINVLNQLKQNDDVFSRRELLRIRNKAAMLSEEVRSETDKRLYENIAMSVDHLDAAMVRGDCDAGMCKNKK